MKSTFALAGVVVIVFVAGARAQSTAFTYQGQLKDGGTPASGLHDFRFKLFDAATGGAEVGITQCVDNLQVAGGLFTATIDFGNQFTTPAQRFVEIEVRRDTGLSCANTTGFTVLTTRQAITAAPIATHARSAFSLDAADGSPASAVVVDNNGNVGIGTTTPLNRLHVASAALGDGIRLTGSPGNDPGFSLFENTTPRGTLGLAMAAASWSQDAAAGDIVLRSEAGRKLLMQSGPFASGLAISSGNNVGIGTSAPLAKLHVDSGDLYLGLPSNGWFLHTRSPFGGDFLHLTDTVGGVPQFQRGITLSKSGSVGIKGPLTVNGTTRTQILEITVADLAEKFPASERLDAGMVVAIDREHAGKLCLARGAYNRCVAGVVSGANNFSVGAVLGNLPGQDDAPAVVLSGRVYVWCDASDSAVEPGDLLTTSETPGHAMKVMDPGRAGNAVIGKAMSRLDRGGRGLVLVLVNLQ